MKYTFLYSRVLLLEILKVPLSLHYLCIMHVYQYTEFSYQKHLLFQIFSMFNLDLNIPLAEEKYEEPFIGQTFQSIEEAHIFYKNYAEANGFTVRKDRSATRHGKAIRRDLYCHRGGKKPLKPIHPSKVQRNRESSKCECKAHMRLTLKQSNDIFPEEWHVTKFIKEHNHNLLSPTSMRLLPINRVITTEDESQILLYKEAGLSVRQIIRVMELQKEVKHGDLSFIERDVRNLFVKVKKLVEVSDAQRFIEALKCAKQKDEKFQYIYTMDDGRRLENVFWCHAQSFEWYKMYGDVVVFDTTYKVNAYDMPCAFFVGIDNHGKSILFGSALLRNETTQTFRWLMKVRVVILLLVIFFCFVHFLMKSC